ncbi:MAG: hypothetical protein ABSG76_24240 [Xanthobacteraceae bacterium]|jgi:hypothetical protein
MAQMFNYLGIKQYNYLMKQSTYHGNICSGLHLPDVCLGCRLVAAVLTSPGAGGPALAAGVAVGGLQADLALEVAHCDPGFAADPRITLTVNYGDSELR